jgi:hypothetical protein
MSETGSGNVRTRVEFEVVKDAWQHLALADGSKLRVKLVVLDVFRGPQEGTTIQYELAAQLVVMHEPPPPDATTKTETDK